MADAAENAALGATLGATMKGKAGESVKVVVRVRPLNDKEKAEGRTVIVQMDPSRGVATLYKPGGTDRDFKEHTYDAVYDERFTQKQIFDDTASDILDAVMDGFNGTIFAYGQTGAGKSHTMTGPAHCAPELRGLLPRTFTHVFNDIDTTSKDTRYLVRVSFLEIYNEEIRDLLSKNPKERCELKDHPSNGVYVKDLSTVVVKNVDEMEGVLATGLSSRSVAATNMNEGSSRSHSLFMITVEQAKMVDKEEKIRVGKLNMVDLAGSERQSKTGATGERLKEATKINLSLSALGNVISALVDGKSSYIPYRDSKLTRLLQDSLGGNTKTVMVANCGPADYNYDETLSTLRYAYRAKSIKNKPKINEDPKDAMIREFQDEIMRLKAELESGVVAGIAEEVVEEAAAPAPAAPPPPPRIEKQIEYVEKEVIVEKQKEVVVETGLKPEQMRELESNLRKQNEEIKKQAERRREEVAAQRNLAESERKRVFAEIEREQKEALAAQAKKSELEQKLAAMQQQMVMGNAVMEKAIEQEEELKRQQKELKRQRKKEEQLRQQEEQQRQQNFELETKCASQEEQVQKLTVKLQKLWDKYQRAQQEMVDIQQFNQSEREDMLSMIRDLRQTLKLKTLIMESFVPPKEVQSIQERALWDAEEDEWRMKPLRIDKDNVPIRPPSALGLPRPTSEFSRINRAMGDQNPRYLYDCIVQTDLDLPERTTEDYEVHPDLGDHIERCLLNALSPDDDDAPVREDQGEPDERPHKRSDRPSTASKKRPSSGRPGTARKHGGGDASHAPAAFPQARGLVSRE